MSKSAQSIEAVQADTTDQWIQEHKAEIDREADSDGPHAWVFQRIRQESDCWEGDS
ncbi:hypothetical protein [Halorarum salinum]|uniref:Uncharacterized protein n=1 Tax=Halorarum salinum TaxID=2743089 RepID=A0A7D5LBE3_9EURY|nr:hypothetical protein [Halobaculum salinum]QLG62866.1 hypothetical protein HUG12_14465 [Halobaculum salinum]